MKLNMFWSHPFPWVMTLIFSYIILHISYVLIRETPVKEKAVYSIEIHDGDSVVIYKNHYKNISY
jgi:hypothetical protein